MILNYIWIGFFLIGFLVAIFRVMGYYFRDFFLEHFNLIFSIADRDVFSAIVQSTFDMAKTSVEISIYLIGVMTLWLGIMKIGEKGGAVECTFALDESIFQQDLSGNTQKSSGHGFHHDEFQCQYAGTWIMQQHPWD